jgi:excisionase family DNA binding protein
VIGSAEEGESAGDRHHHEDQADDEAGVDTPEPRAGTPKPQDTGEGAHGRLETAAGSTPVTRPAGTMPGVPTRTDTHPEAALVAERSRFLQPGEVAEVLSVTVSQVYTLMRSGQLPAVKIGKRGVWRVSTEALEAYIAELEREARARRGA